MKQPKQSRGTQIDIEKIRQRGNIYQTIIAASQRAYQLRKGQEPLITDHSDPYNSGVVTALLEIQSGKI